MKKPGILGIGPRTGRQSAVPFTMAGQVRTTCTRLRSGTTVTANKPVQVQVVAGGFWSGNSSEMRMFSLLPRALWANAYYSPVADLPDNNCATAPCPRNVAVELYVYTADMVRQAARKSFGLEQKPMLSKIDNLVVGQLASN